MKITISTRPHIITEYIGEEKSPVLICDDYFPAPDTLQQAAQNAFFIKGGEVYPGLRASLPSGYLSRLTDTVSDAVQATFKGRISGGFENSTFSMVTTPPEKLKYNQCVPHTDENDENYLAFIHYLCDERFGGTNFYRHKPTGYERVTEARAPRYNAAMGSVIREKMASNVRTQYFTNDDPFFECVHSAENKFNRLVIYSGANLHSGNILRPDLLSENPQKGRLTITGFMRIIPNHKLQDKLHGSNV